MQDATTPEIALDPDVPLQSQIDSLLANRLTLCQNGLHQMRGPGRCTECKAERAHARTSGLPPGRPRLDGAQDPPLRVERFEALRPHFTLRERKQLALLRDEFLRFKLAVADRIAAQLDETPIAFSSSLDQSAWPKHLRGTSE